MFDNNKEEQQFYQKLIKNIIEKTVEYIQSTDTESEAENIFEDDGFINMIEATRKATLLIREYKNLQEHLQALKMLTSPNFKFV